MPPFLFIVAFMYRAVFNKKKPNTLSQIKATAYKKQFRFKYLRAMERDGLYIIEYEMTTLEGNDFMFGYIKAFPGCSTVYRTGKL